ncbi:MAG: hypothetical protein K2N48_10465 [Muribaculaceae bacterium]|nr:hypothetical protein [Muribaculaceae bacterium]
MIKLGERIEFPNSTRYSHGRDITFDGNMNLYGLLKEVGVKFQGYTIDVYVQDRVRTSTLTDYEKIGTVECDDISITASNIKKTRQVYSARIMFRSSLRQHAEIRIILNSEKKTDDLIPLNQVLSDMSNPDGGMAACAARSYYYEHYATDEQKAKMDKDERRNTILIAVFSILLSAILVGSTAVAWYSQAKG